jgi:hypothetical protein
MQWTLSIQQLATANAGVDELICSTDDFPLNGQAEHYASVIWTTSGTGLSAIQPHYLQFIPQVRLTRQLVLSC